MAILLFFMLYCRNFLIQSTFIQLYKKQKLKFIMNKKQINRFNMYLSTVEFCEKNSAISSPLPSFNTNMNNLKMVADAMRLIVQHQAGDITGTTAVKKDFKETLVVWSADSARKLMAFAKLTKNQKLLKDISYSETDLRHLPDTTLPDTAMLIYNYGQQYLSELGSYQINNQTQETLLQAITNLKQSASTPRTEMIGKAQNTQQLIQLFKTGDEALANMDAVIEIVRLSQPDFYAGYKLARKVIETGNSKMSVKGTVIDQTTAQPIAGATVSFWPDGDMAKTVAAGDAMLIKKSAAKGGFYVNTLTSGTYRVLVQKTGYTEQMLTVFVNDGEMTTMDVKLVKV
jgi:hypothetical protein